MKRTPFKLARWSTVIVLSLLFLGKAYIAAAQPERVRVSRLATGTLIEVRTTEPIEVERRDAQVFRGTVDRDIHGDAGGLVIPRGSAVELMVRRGSSDTEMIVDLDSVTVEGQRYAVKTEPNQVEARGGLIGSIVGAIAGSRGPVIRLPRDTVLTFRLDRPLDVDVPDRGVDRNGRHWHDWER
jgi:hypothetical protein